MLDSLTEAEVCAACFSILGSSQFYRAEELEFLQVGDVEKRSVDALVAKIRSSSFQVVDLFEKWLVVLRSGSVRHAQGMVFTPDGIVQKMVASLMGGSYARIVDCGCGAGRFILTAAKADGLQADSQSKLVAVDVDPLACLLTATAASVLNVEVEVVRSDFLEFELDGCEGATAFIGNPPYVRHHDLSPLQKSLGKDIARSVGLNHWSKLAGLHTLFIEKCLQLSNPGDAICLLTSAEWLDVNYGAALRGAFASDVGGGQALEYYDPLSMVFEGTMTTALISWWEPGKPCRDGISFVMNTCDGGRVYQLMDPAHLSRCGKWLGACIGGCDDSGNEGWIELGELFKVSRGVVTGSNAFFVVKADDAHALGIDKYCVPVVARASDIPTEGDSVSVNALGKMLLCVPEDVKAIEPELEHYFETGVERGVNRGHIASHRKVWWSINYRSAPILATYMSRSRPRFALNPDGCPSLNTVHGLFPIHDMTDADLRACVKYLNSGELGGDSGRVYQGGLHKFEPREMERIKVPPLDKIREWSEEHAA